MIHAFSVLEFSENYCWRWRCRLGNYWSRVLDDGFETDYELIEVLTPEHNFCFAYGSKWWYKTDQGFKVGIFHT